MYIKGKKTIGPLPYKQRGGESFFCSVLVQNLVSSDSPQPKATPTRVRISVIISFISFLFKISLTKVKQKIELAK